MDNIKQESPSEGPILNDKKQVTWQSLNKKFGTNINTFKNKQCIIPRNKVISGKPSWDVKNLVLP